MKNRSSLLLAAALTVSAFVQNLAATGNEDPPFHPVSETGSSVLLIVVALAGVALLKRAFNRR